MENSILTLGIGQNNLLIDVLTNNLRFPVQEELMVIASKETKAPMSHTIIYMPSFM